MNTKETMLKVLEEQFKAKNEENEKLKETEISPKFNDLTNRVKEFFLKNNVIDENMNFIFTGEKIEFNDIRFYLNNTYHEYNKWNMSVSWYGSSASNTEPDKINYLKLLGKVSNILPKLENCFFDWYKEYKIIYKPLWDRQDEYRVLQNAINSLKNEIENDLESSFKQIGFELKPFKEDYDYNMVEGKYVVTTKPKQIRLQIGRSKYDTAYINGYKVLGKKGNKYEIEIYKEGWSSGRTYNILEKKMDDFVSDVRNWETKGYERSKQNIERTVESFNNRNR